MHHNHHDHPPMIRHAWQANALSCVIGIVWGCCNGINKHCSTASPSPHDHPFWLVQLFSNPLFYLAQGVNALASACFVWLTGQHACSLAIAVACANGTSLAVTACIDVLSHHRSVSSLKGQHQVIDIRLVTVGLLLTLCGVTLCALG